MHLVCLFTAIHQLHFHFILCTGGGQCPQLDTVGVQLFLLSAEREAQQADGLPPQTRRAD